MKSKTKKKKRPSESLILSKFSQRRVKESKENNPEREATSHRELPQEPGGIDQLHVSKKEKNKRKFIFKAKHYINLEKAKPRTPKAAHKYLRREPDGKGGWHYIYKNDKGTEAKFRQAPDYAERKRRADHERVYTVPVEAELHEGHYIIDEDFLDKDTLKKIEKNEDYVAVVDGWVMFEKKDLRKFEKDFHFDLGKDESNVTDYEDVGVVMPGAKKDDYSKRADKLAEDENTREIIREILNSPDHMENEGIYLLDQVKRGLYLGKHDPELDKSNGMDAGASYFKSLMFGFIPASPAYPWSKEKIRRSFSGQKRVAKYAQEYIEAVNFVSESLDNVKTSADVAAFLQEWKALAYHKAEGQTYGTMTKYYDYAFVLGAKISKLTGIHSGARGKRLDRTDLQNIEAAIKTDPDDWSWVDGKIKKVRKKSDKPDMVQYAPERVDRKGGRKFKKKPEQKTLLNELGLRGAQYGKSLPTKEREYHTVSAIEAFYDLSDVLGMKPKEMSLKGKLGIGFGARGRGKARAHYESSTDVINITRFAGGGCLAHEWGHFLDKTFAGKISGADGDRFFMHELRGSGEAIQDKDMRKAYQGLQHALHKSGPEQEKEYTALIDAHKEKIATKTAEIKAAGGELYKDLRLTDLRESLRTIIHAKHYGQSIYKVKSQLQGVKYWGNGQELFARAFESYVQDKLTENKRKNTYLVYGTKTYSEKNDGDFTQYDVYPRRGDRQRINKAFDEFFKHVNKTGIVRKALMDFFGAEEKLEKGQRRPPQIKTSGKKPSTGAERGHDPYVKTGKDGEAKFVQGSNAPAATNKTPESDDYKDVYGFLGIEEYPSKKVPSTKIETNTKGNHDTHWLLKWEEGGREVFGTTAKFKEYIRDKNMQRLREALGRMEDNHKILYGSFIRPNSEPSRTESFLRMFCPQACLPVKFANSIVEDIGLKKDALSVRVGTETYEISLDKKSKKAVKGFRVHKKPTQKMFTYSTTKEPFNDHNVFRVVQDCDFIGRSMLLNSSVRSFWEGQDAPMISPEQEENLDDIAELILNKLTMPLAARYQISSVEFLEDLATVYLTGMIKEALLGHVQKSSSMGGFDEDTGVGETNPLTKVGEQAIDSNSSNIVISKELPTAYKVFREFILGDKDEGRLS